MARVKGMAMIVAAKNLRHFKKKAARLLPEHLQKYLTERILISNWYPEEDHVALMRVLADILPEELSDIGDEDIYSYMGRFSCRYALSSVYGKLVSYGDQEATLKKADMMWQLYNDTGSLQVSVTGPGRATMELRDHGYPSTEGCRMNMGWFSEVIRASGAKAVRVEETSCRAKGDSECIWQLEWE